VCACMHLYISACVDGVYVVLPFRMCVSGGAMIKVTMCELCVCVGVIAYVCIHVCVCV